MWSIPKIGPKVNVAHLKEKEE